MNFSFYSNSNGSTPESKKINRLYFNKDLIVFKLYPYFTTHSTVFFFLFLNRIYSKKSFARFHNLPVLCKTFYSFFILSFVQFKVDSKTAPTQISKQNYFFPIDFTIRVNPSPIWSILT